MLFFHVIWTETLIKKIRLYFFLCVCALTAEVNENNMRNSDEKTSLTSLLGVWLQTDIIISVQLQQPYSPEFTQCDETQ